MQWEILYTYERCQKAPGRQKAGFPVAQMVKNLPAMQETWIWSLGCEDPLEKKMAAHSSFLAGRIPWTEKPTYSNSYTTNDPYTTSLKDGCKGQMK